MSMELYVLSDRQLESIAAWQIAIDASHFPLRVSLSTPFARLNGVLPVQLGDRQTVFECVHWNAAELMAELADIDFGRRWKFVLAFRWTGNPYEGIAAYMAAGAYAKATGGIVFDCEEGKIISPERAGEIAREIERDIPMIEEMVRKAVEKIRK